MLGQLINKLFGKSVDFRELIEQGAIILDVRTAQEFKSGHIKGAKNMALQQLPQQLGKLDKNKVIITCCKSGVRSANAKSILTQNGFEVYNGGGWQSLQNKLN